MKIILTTEIYDNWFDRLRDNQAKARIKARLRRVCDDNFGDVKPVGNGVSEMRIHYGPGYRLYFMQKKFEIVILLAGGDKSTQAQDIESALYLAKELKGE